MRGELAFFNLFFIFFNFLGLLISYKLPKIHLNVVIFCLEIFFFDGEFCIHHLRNLTVRPLSRTKKCGFHHNLKSSSNSKLIGSDRSSQLGCKIIPLC